MFAYFRKPCLTVALYGCLVTGAVDASDRPDLTAVTANTSQRSPAQQLVERGQARLAQGEYAAARSDFERAWRAGDHSPEVHWHIIRCLVGEQKFGLAEEESYRLLNDHPEMTPVFVTLAQIAFLTEDYPLAIEHATKAISQGVRMADACFIRAYAHARLGNFNVALANIKVSLAESNRETEFRAEAPYLLHGAILKQLQQHRDALLAYERALRVNENSMDALLGQWECYQQMQMASAAFLVAEEMLKINPIAIETLQACAVSHRQYEEFEIAARFAARWRAASLPDSRPCVEESKSLIGLGQWQLARGALEEALIRDDQCLPALGDLARLLVSCPDSEVRDAIYAEQLAQRACELSHWDSPPLIATLAAAHAAQGHAEIAVDLMTRSLVLLPADDASRELYADLRQQYSGARTTAVATEVREQEQKAQ